MPDFDLNLLRVFVRLCETTSVTETAESLQVTQPSVSYSLRRLRERFDDQLFRRTGRGLVATPVAEQLYAPLRRALEEIDGAIGRTQSFEPATADDRLVLALSDLGEVTLLPRLVTAVHRVAPGVRFTVQPLDVNRAEQQLARGELDAFIATPVLSSGRSERIPLFAEHNVAVVSADHPRLDTAPSIADLAQERFATVFGPSGHSGPRAALERAGLLGRVALDVTRFSMLPYLVERTDLVAIVPEYAAQVFAETHRVRSLPLPFPTDPIEVALYALPDARRSAAQRWLVDFALTVLGRKTPPAP